MSNVKDMLNELLVDMFNHILYLEEQGLKDAGIKLSMTEIHVIEAINKSKNRKMSEIAKRLKITTGTLTVAIKKLEQKGYVVRTKDINDRRIVIATLTAKGERMLKIHDQFHKELIDDIISQITIEEGKVLIKTLGRVQGYLTAKYD